ncbi:methyltransferase domain-containing protein [bacterium]|nr:methyltransferase domain-containing protein [bacterium]
MTNWNPDLYLTFGGERTRAAADLLARVPVAAPARVIDLGCGPGNSTALLRARWPGADLTGLDNDPAMLTAARASDPGVRWVEDSATWWTASAPYDVVFSNAALQWLPDHAGVLDRWFAAVAPGGALAVQLPVVHPRSPLHRLVWDVAEAFGVADSGTVCHASEFYYDVLAPHATTIDLWETEYAHVLDGPDAMLTWLRGTRLRPLLSALPDDEARGRFEVAVRDRLAAAYPSRADGRVLFPFPRLFFVATRR